MKRLFFIFISLFLYYSGYCQKTIKNSLYEVVYSEIFEQPISLTYTYPDPFKFQNSFTFTDTITLHKVELEQIEFTSIFIKDSISEFEILGYYIDENGNKYKKRPQTKDEEVIEYPKARVLDTIINIEYVDRKEWRKPKGIITSDDNDYDRPYDRGHLVPFASFKEDSLTDYMFSYLNCALMHQSLNRGLWSKLESYERELSKISLLEVSVVLSFINFNQTKGGAIIPDYFTKVLDYKIIDNNKEVSRQEIFHFPNDSTVKGNSLINYKLELK
jgi:hypothetical protein